MFRRKRRREETVTEAHRLFSQSVRDGGAGGEYAAYLDEAIRRYPDESRLRVLRGVLLAGKDPDRSWTELQAAAVRAMDDPATLFRVASAWHYIGDPVSAEKIGRHIETIMPEHFVFAADLISLFGLIAWDLDNLELAERELRRALRMEPTNGAVAANLVDFLAQTGRSAEARAVAHSGARALERNAILADSIARVRD